MKRLFWDIESSHNVVLSFEVGSKVYVPWSNILDERRIICIAYKWGEDGKTKLIHWDKSQDDGPMLRQFAEIAAEADELVAHYGDGFDIKMFMARCLFHGISTFPKYKTVDTYKMARRAFKLNSYAMDYIAKYCGVGRKTKTDPGLWVDVLVKNDRKALKKMCEYCMQDVEVLKDVYVKIAPYTTHQTHVGVMMGNEKWSCASCGSLKVGKAKTRISAMGTPQHQMQCKECGRYHTISNAALEAWALEK